MSLHTQEIPMLWEHSLHLPANSVNLKEASESP